MQDSLIEIAVLHGIYKTRILNSVYNSIEDAAIIILKTGKHNLLL